MDVAAAEAALGLKLPPFLARVYAEVGDGGFGPGEGLLPLAEVVRRTRELRTGEELPRGRTWPAALLPVLRLDPGCVCVHATTGAVVEWDPLDLEEHSGEARFRRSFVDRSPSVQAWLGTWVVRKTAADRNKPSQAERWERMRARAQSPKGQAWQRRKTFTALEAMSPEERAEHGFAELYEELRQELARDDPKPA